MPRFGNVYSQALAQDGEHHLELWQWGESWEEREGSAQAEPKGQKYLRKDERKYKWDLAAGQSPAFFAR